MKRWLLHATLDVTCTRVLCVARALTPKRQVGFGRGKLLNTNIVRISSERSKQCSEHSVHRDFGHLQSPHLQRRWQATEGCQFRCMVALVESSFHRDMTWLWFYTKRVRGNPRLLQPCKPHASAKRKGRRAPHQHNGAWQPLKYSNLNSLRMFKVQWKMIKIRP